MKVKVFKMDQIKEQIKASPEELQKYIKALERSSDRWEQLFYDALKKVRGK